MSAKKFILVGGYPHKALDGGKSFYENLVQGFDEPAKVLVCLFARPEDTWPKAFQQDKDYFSRNLPEIQVETRLATREHFIEELAWCNSIYFRGGDIDLTSIMAHYPGWEIHLDEKIVAGSSMGADMLSKYYFNIVTNTIEKGSGTTNAKVVVHWKSPEYANTQWEEGYRQLENIDKGLQTYTLAEGEFAIVP